MGKLIYEPSGKAREYAPWACNLHVGCSNDCSYCFNKRGVLGTVSGGTQARLKSCFKDEDDAFAAFLKELQKKADRIRGDGGLLFSFSTDPCLPGTLPLTMACVSAATEMGVPCHILTKRADWILRDGTWTDGMAVSRDLLSIGFTLTGRDDLERGASTNAERVLAMKTLHGKGYRTFASIEPVISFDDSLAMIRRALPWCDLFKVGLLSGDSHAYDRYLMPYDLETFVYRVNELLTEKGVPVYWKRSVRTALGADILAPCLVDSRYDPVTAIRIVLRHPDGNLSWDELDDLSRDAGTGYSVVHHQATPAIRRAMKEMLRNAVYEPGTPGILEYIEKDELLFDTKGTPYKKTCNHQYTIK